MADHSNQARERMGFKSLWKQSLFRFILSLCLIFLLALGSFAFNLWTMQYKQEKALLEQKSQALKNEKEVSLLLQIIA